MSFMIDGISVVTNDVNATEKEIGLYVNELRKSLCGEKVSQICLTVDGDWLNVSYK